MSFWYLNVVLHFPIVGRGDDEELIGILPLVVNETFEREPPQTMTKSTTSKMELKLTVPYYVYTESNLNWENHTFVSNNNDQTEYTLSKHSDDYWLYQASLRHPLRTYDPNQAGLFFVPFMLNAVSERKTCIQLNVTTERCFRRPGHAFQYANEQLGLSKYFQRHQGKDHVVVISHWLTPMTKKIHNLLNCNLINFEGRIPIPKDGISYIPSFYVGRGCRGDIQKTHDFVLIATFRPTLIEFRDRENICRWLLRKDDDDHHPTRYSVAACGQGDQCPSIGQARYGFHPRGDTFGSNRVMDLLLSRTVPIFTDPYQYEILPNFVPWRKLSYLANVTTKETFEASIASLLSQLDSEYKEKILWIDKYMVMFDHTGIYQFDSYMAEFAKRRKLQ